MKGIYALFEFPTMEDMYWICRARGVFDQVTVAFSLSLGTVGKDYIRDISRVRKVLDNSEGLSIDFFREGSFVNFLDNSQKKGEIVLDEQGVFLGTREVRVDMSRLIIPGHKPSLYEAVNFPKYSFNLNA